MTDRMDTDYVKFFISTLSDKAGILYTHRTPLKVLRDSGNVIPGQAEPSKVERIFDILIPRKHTIAPKPIPVRVFVPKGDAPTSGWPLFLWFHGGGWVLGGINTENSFCTKLTDEARATVISVDYRIAPEDPFPACVEDAFEAVLWGVESAGAELGIDISNIGLGGSSAGGNLTAVVCHKFANSDISESLPPVKIQILVVPVIDNTAFPENNVSWKENEFTPQLPSEKMLWYRYLYLPQEVDHDNPEASPIFYPNESFKKLPPCFIAACERDVLRSEAEEYAKKLKENGIKTETVISKRMPHTTMVMDGVLEKGKRFVSDITSAAKNAFYP